MTTALSNEWYFSLMDDTISITTVKEPSGGWKAVAIRSNDEERDALISSEPCDSIQKAFESLHAKSAEATAVYIKTNGYGQLPSYKKSEDLSDDDTASVMSGSEHSAATSVALSTWESSDEELVTPASSSKPDSASSKSSKKNRKRGKTQKNRKYESETDDELADDGPIRQAINPVRHPAGRAVARPAPQTAGWTGPPQPPPPMYRPGAMPVLQPPPPRPSMASGPSGPPTPAAQVPPPPGFRPMGPGVNPRLFDTRITINWLHHSEQRIFESCRASIRALQDTTVAYVRGHMDAFDNVTPLDHSPTKIWTLRANIKRAFFGSEAYDMSGYRGDDLTKLFNVLGKNDIPRFEIEVDYVRPPSPGHAMTPGNASSMQ
ncbi:hypothetical protein BKA67DRAFT_658895 [Truncatella angustata]|uniref:Uncharacterized protein n=1 Tax=Truncatella angustata TaxID=152316 RepID=A0A9P8UL87_9PEZI|nr:uncharacterized protein BKA67DRAFT_658895 [Truncatella angustata]KAH6654610.1 hypothetical protein BKA67DRAFT_658895 [Truncatella angustata]KAH8203345.1 hypothetical protein TruAng_002440 [Truncatella angustata]